MRVATEGVTSNRAAQLHHPSAPSLTLTQHQPTFHSPAGASKMER